MEEMSVMPYSDFTTSLARGSKLGRPDLMVNEDQVFTTAKQKWQQHPSDLFKEWRTSQEPSYEVVEMHI